MCSCKNGISGLGDEYGTYVDWSNPDYNNPTYASTTPWSGNPGANPVGSGGSSGWLNALTASIKGATSILGTRYAVPQLNPGQLIQTGPNGQSLMYQGTAGNMSSFPSLSSMSLGGSSSMLPLLAIGAVVLIMMKK